MFFGFRRRWIDFVFVGTRNVLIDFVFVFSLPDFRFLLFGSRKV
jgi:hypothetical protein